MSHIRPGKMAQLDLEKSPISPFISVFCPHNRIAILAEDFASLMPMFLYEIHVKFNGKKVEIKDQEEDIFE